MKNHELRGVVTVLWMFMFSGLGADAAESYSRWKKEQIIEIAVKYIADTKDEFARRAGAVKSVTGEDVALDY